MKKKWIAVALAGALAAGLTACGGGGSTAQSSGSGAAAPEAAGTETAASGDGTAITIFNSKMEIQS